MVGHTVNHTAARTRHIRATPVKKRRTSLSKEDNVERSREQRHDSIVNLDGQPISSGVIRYLFVGYSDHLRDDDIFGGVRTFPSRRTIKLALPLLISFAVQI